MDSLDCQAAELELYPAVGVEPWNSILKGDTMIRDLCFERTLWLLCGLEGARIKTGSLVTRVLK